MWNLKKQDGSEYTFEAQVPFKKSNILTLECMEYKGGKYRLYLSFSAIQDDGTKSNNLAFNQDAAFDFAPTTEQAKKWASAKIKEMFDCFASVL